MDLQGIAALAAAAAAAIAVPATVLVGRWTTHAAQDAARKAAEAQHTQWVRSTRREAYAAFMVSAMELRQVAEDLPLAKQAIPREDFNALMGEFRSALRKCATALAVVRLEGPDDAVAKAGEALHDAIFLYWRTLLRLGSVTRARAKLKDLTRSSDPEKARQARELDEHLHEGRACFEQGDSGASAYHTQRARVLLESLQDEFLGHEATMLVRTTWEDLDNTNRLAREVDAKSRAFVLEARRALP
ncbi:hypothetical protein [Streptomyces sp. E1N211]|uniref:hypothetical protein n=1 Tax=Streptomyces sp. E1N211 TaxID=1851876 RepID=UPI0012D8D69A|nr:hypothetical protein [Streptomyces sp. E1N211]